MTVGRVADALDRFRLWQEGRVSGFRVKRVPGGWHVFRPGVGWVDAGDDPAAVVERVRELKGEAS